jgi:hypothetical protein
MRTMRTKQRFSTERNGFYDPAWLPEGRLRVAGKYCASVHKE